MSYRAMSRNIETGRPIVEFGRTRLLALQNIVTKLQELGIA